MDNLEWQCKIDEGLAGMSYARWAPDSRRVLTICEFNIRMTIWSLIDRSTAYLNFPKFADKALSFTSNGSFMALGERKDSKDFIGIYFTGDWTLVSHFQVESYDMQEVFWSKDNTALIVQDSPLECKFLIYSPTGNLIQVHEPYKLTLGVKNMNMSPNGHYLTAGFYDGAVRIYNHITWKLIIDLEHPSNINDCSNINVFKEEEAEEISYSGDRKKTAKYTELKTPNLKFATSKYSLDKPNPPVGISEMNWSFDSNFLACKNDNFPNVLFVWQISSLSLHTIIIQMKPIKNFSWSPTEHILLIATENNKLYSFTLNNIYVIELVTDLNMNLTINKINWNSNGKSFTVGDGKSLVIGHPEISEEEENYAEEVNEIENDNNRHRQDMEVNEMSSENLKMNTNLQRSIDEENNNNFSNNYNNSYNEQEGGEVEGEDGEGYDHY